MIITLQNFIQAVQEEFICVGYSHKCEPFQAHPQGHDWWRITWLFQELS
jgi:hypothetical protein